MNRKTVWISVAILAIIIVIAVAVTLVLVLRGKKHKKSEIETKPLDDVISEDSTFPNGSYTIRVDSLSVGRPELAPLLVDISTLSTLGVSVDYSSFIAETNRLNYFFLRVPRENSTQARSKRQTNTDLGMIGVRFGNAATINVIPLNISLIENSGLTLIGTLNDQSRVYQVEVRMANAMCANNVLGSCSAVSWTPYSIYGANFGSAANFNTVLPVACGSQCDTAMDTLCSVSCSPCDGQQVAGANTPVTRRFKMGTTSASGIGFRYETYTVKDRIIVSYEGKSIFDSGCVGTEGEKVAPIGYSGTSGELRVDVEPNCEGTLSTAWYFNLPCASPSNPSTARPITTTPAMNTTTSPRDCRSRTCDEYQCLDDTKAHCGPSGYLINYGLYYCQRYGAYYNDFDQNGKNFIDCVRPRLLSFLEDYFAGVTGPVNCQALFNQAFASHLPIYTGCGFCSIWSSNKWALTEVLAMNILNWSAWEQLGSIVVSCVGLAICRQELCDPYPFIPCACS